MDNRDSQIYEVWCNWVENQKLFHKENLDLELVWACGLCDAKACDVIQET